MSKEPKSVKSDKMFRKVSQAGEAVAFPPYILVLARQGREPYMIFVKCNTCGAGVKRFSLV